MGGGSKRNGGLLLNGVCGSGACSAGAAAEKFEGGQDRSHGEEDPVRTMGLELVICAPMGKFVGK